LINILSQLNILKLVFLAKVFILHKISLEIIQASILSAPSFNPIPESQTLFIDDYRAHQYLAGGLKAIATPYTNLDVRFEGYLFQPVYLL
jgi:hypothetical protein